jgi:hypothetical protein
MAIVENVLAPFSIEKHLKYILNNNNKFSISTDASNKGNMKIFPVAIQYFNTKEGLINFVLDLFEDSDESSFKIHDNLKRVLAINQLKIENLLSYGADNASVNYGRHNSVFKNFYDENEFLVKSNCNCHILHNAAKYGLFRLPFDIESLVLKIYNHFSNSAKRESQLKSCYEFTENNYSKVLRHVTTRWLSLYPAIDRLIENFEALKLYFTGLNENDYPLIISQFFWETSCNEKSDQNFNQMLLYFVHQYMKLFHETILKLEMKSTNSTNLYDIMSELKTKLENRIKYNFFGSFLNTQLKQITKNEKEKFEKVSKNSYERALIYLNKWFDFENSIFKKFSCLNLDKELNYNEINEICVALNISVDRDALFDECCMFNELFKIIQFEDKKLTIVELYCKILSKNDFKKLSKVIECVLAIPIENDFVERIFSVMQNLWTDERNRMSINLVKAEICTRFNFSLSCYEFHEYVKNNSELLSAAKSDKKYKFRHN